MFPSLLHLIKVLSRNFIRNSNACDLLCTVGYKPVHRLICHLCSLHFFFSSLFFLAALFSKCFFFLRVLKGNCRAGPQPDVNSLMIRIIIDPAKRAL